MDRDKMTGELSDIYSQMLKAWEETPVEEIDIPVIKDCLIQLLKITISQSRRMSSNMDGFYSLKDQIDEIRKEL